MSNEPGFQQVNIKRNTNNNIVRCQSSRAPTRRHQETNEQEQTTLSVKHIDSHGETPRFCTMTCPIDGGATLSCHRHTDMSTASAAGWYYAPASKALQPTGVTLPEGSLTSQDHSRLNALPHLTLTNTYPSRFITYDDNRVGFNDKLTSRNI